MSPASGGGGVYRIYTEQVDIGYDVGGGLRVPPLHAFVEARVHLIHDGPDYFPITVGFRF